MTSAEPDGLEFEVLDVFTRTAFEGNPLAVVLGGDDLSTEQMQALAVEFALSETAFPLIPDDDQRRRGVDYVLRIFTPRHELPFAGHPSVGTAWLLADRGEIAPGRVVQACGAGELPLEVAAGGGRVTLTGGTPELGAAVDAADVIAALGLEPADLAGPPPRRAGTGVLFCHVHVTREGLERVQPDPRRLAGIGSVYLVAWPAGGGEPVRARMFGPGMGIAEDPATGSAALGLAVSAVSAGLLPADGTSAFTVLQGEQMGRPSWLHVEVDAAGGSAVRARVSGDAVRVSRGRIRVPGARPGEGG